MPSFHLSKGLRKFMVGREVFETGERYRNLKPIGDSSYGLVVSAIDTLAPLEHQNVAVKKIGDVFCDIVDNAKRVLREIKLLKHFDGHEIFGFRISSCCFPFKNKDVYIITNLMESDMDRIIRSNQNLSDEHFRYFLYQILRGLKFIHSANVLHRDLKPSNLLVNANCDLAICDFGLARQVDSEDATDLTEYVVTRWYRAPELLCDSNHYGKTIDMWSVGCIFAEMITRQPFFQGNNPIHQLQTIVSVLGTPSEEDLRFIKHPAAREAILSYPSNVAEPFSSHFPADTNPLALDFLRSLLTFNPEKRITVIEAIKHPYLADLHGQMDEPVCNKPFSFEYECMFKKNHNVLREELQKVIYEDALQFRCPECIDIAGSVHAKGNGG